MSGKISNNPEPTERPAQAGATGSVVASSARIPSNYSRLVARELGLQVRELPALLALTRLTTEDFLNENTLLTYQQQVQILQNGLRLANDEEFGLRLGQRLTPATHGAMGFLANSSPNLLLALSAFQTFLPTRVNFARLELITTDQWLECHGHIDIEVSADIRRLLSEAFATVFLECGEFIVGRPLTEAVIRFDYPAPDYMHSYAEYLPGNFEFSAAALMAKIPMQLCKIPNASANHENYLMALQQCETMLAELHSSEHSTTLHIQKMMLSHPTGVISEEEAAAALFISKRTLARRLKLEGSGFRQIRDEILSQQAAGYLRDSRLSVDAIAALLNYHDSANFRRAFKRWFQLSPDQYRQQLKAV